MSAPSPSRRTRRAVAAVALAASLAATAGTVPAAHAQVPLGSLAPEQISEAVNQQLANVSPESLSQVLFFTGAPGSSRFSLINLAAKIGFSPNIWAGFAPPAPRPDATITQTRLLDKVVDGRYEQWHIASARMQRVVTVEIYRAPAGSGPAPSLYLLDGVGSELPSGFMQWGAKEQFADERVNLIVPTGGQGSMWADWNAPDPALGISKWESFLTQDLPGLVEPQLNSNGKRGIGGISMGAGAAVTLAAKHPEMYQGVFGVSGCYSTAGLGEVLTTYTVESRGGDANNMWGPAGSEQWAANDGLTHAEALRGKAIYLSSATGVARPGDWNGYHQDVPNFVAGMALEQATNQCTYAADDRLRELGIPARIDHLPVGLHNWSYFAPQIPVAWQSIRGALD